MNCAKYNKNDIVKTCKYIERGVAFQWDGIRCCCVSTRVSPIIVTAKEINDGCINYEFIQKRKYELFDALNKKNAKSAGDCENCLEVYETEYKNVDLSSVGGEITINIQHFSKCNLRCRYCYFTENNIFESPIYSVEKIIDLFDSYIKKRKFRGNNWITLNGGEPTILKKFDYLVKYLINNGIGEVCIFSNSIKHSSEISNRLSKNSVFITTSVDAGIPSVFAKLRGANSLHKVFDTLVRYRKTGTARLWLKYIITPENWDEDNLYFFLFMMLALRPDKVYLTPEFPYGSRENPYESVLFGAKMWYLLQCYGGINIHIQTDDNKVDPKFAKWSADIRAEYEKILRMKPIDGSLNLLEDFSILFKNNIALSSKKEQVETKLLNISMETEHINKKILYIVGSIIGATKVKNRFMLLFEHLLAKYNMQKYVQYYIGRSKLFDASWYLENNPDVACSNIDPILHYIKYGANENRNPSPWFDTKGYYFATQM